MIKKCQICDKDFETNFNKSKFCSKKCRYKYNSNKNKIKFTIYKNILNFSKTIKAINMLGGKCEKCGEQNIFKLCFHHKNNNEKEFKICDMKKYRWSKIENELKKCYLLCENCHRELHFEIEPKINSFRDAKKIYLEYKGGKCEICGYNKCDSALIFHHKNPEEKLFNIGDLCERNITLKNLKENIKEEINKCELLCSNCHSLEHSNIEFFKKYEKEIYEKINNYKETNKKINIKTVINMHINGKKQNEISNYLNCAHSTISDILKEYNEKHK